MNDEKYIFMTDAAEKKKTARNIRNKNRTGKGPVRFPSDYMTKKEREALNGEVSTYNLRRPMKWKEFMSMPMDLQKQYIEWLDQVFNVGDHTLAKMFEVSQSTICLRRKTLGIQPRTKRGRQAHDTILRWETFLKADEPNEPKAPEPPEEKPDEVPEPPEPKATEQKPFGVASGKFDAFASPSELAQMLSVIAGTDRRQYSVQFR